MNELLILVQMKFARFLPRIKAKTLSSICSCPEGLRKDRKCFSFTNRILRRTGVATQVSLHRCIKNLIYKNRKNICFSLHYLRFLKPRPENFTMFASRRSDAHCIWCGIDQSSVISTLKLTRTMRNILTTTPPKYIDPMIDFAFKKFLCLKSK